ncbi:uncharacterized protein RCO7_14177 [Rhynchosporium graminicola]|uniref:Uncharacterized protein n=1 Tax=Rhynchosporium graminicola TaxID=2792576 RepID=A0A1E1K135_9HELO|nr:uncharacterized protein RCO7_14177 [Rhynchosporium commune]
MFSSRCLSAKSSDLFRCISLLRMHCLKFEDSTIPDIHFPGSLIYYMCARKSPVENTFMNTNLLAGVHRVMSLL